MEFIPNYIKKDLINLPSFFQIVNDQFYKKISLTLILFPLSYFFFLIIVIRKYLYQFDILKKYKLSVPVVIVGNITLGGTGKTSLILKIIEELKKQEIFVGVISRGYGAKKKYPQEVFVNSKVEDVGDEPLLLKQKFDVPIFIGKDKASVGNLLIDQYPNVQLILSDDGLQHYKLQRDYEICIIDGERGFGNNLLLPSGPLREPKTRLE